MPPKSMTSIQVKILTYGIYALMFVLSTGMSWLFVQQQALPEKYVRLERYKEDHKSTNAALSRIEGQVNDVRNYLLGEDDDE